MGRRASNPEQRIILTKAQSAGWKVVDTSDGWRVLAPDGRGMVTMHSSSSDRRAIQAMKSDFKRAGLDLDAMNGNGKAKAPQPTLENEAILGPFEGVTFVKAPRSPEQMAEDAAAVAAEPEYFAPTADPDIRFTKRSPEFLPPQPLTTNGRAHAEAKSKRTAKPVTPASPEAVVWEDPPSGNARRGRKGAMDLYRSAMVQNPGKWLVFMADTNSGSAHYYKTKFGHLGFEFRSVSLGDKKFKVYARYVGTGE